MLGRSHSLSNHSAFHRALIAFVCVVMVVLSGSSPTRLASTGWLTRQIDDRNDQIEALNHAAASMVGLDIPSTQDLLEQWVEIAEPTDDDETKLYVLPLDVAATEPQTSFYESPAERTLTPFRLLAFSSRGSPSA